MHKSCPDDYTSFLSPWHIVFKASGCLSLSQDQFCIVLALLNISPGLKICLNTREDSHKQNCVICSLSTLNEEFLAGKWHFWLWILHAVCADKLACLLYACNHSTSCQALVKMAVILIAFLHSLLISYISFFSLTFFFLHMKLFTIGRVIKDLYHAISDGPL